MVNHWGGAGMISLRFWEKYMALTDSNAKKDHGTDDETL